MRQVVFPMDKSKDNPEKLAVDGGKMVHPKPFPPWPQFDRKTDRKVLETAAGRK